jgi:DNA-binding transcriptional MocR family regulator
MKGECHSKGASDAMGWINSVFGQEGDIVLIEDPTYYLAAQLFTDRKQTVRNKRLSFLHGIHPSRFLTVAL